MEKSRGNKYFITKYNEMITDYENKNYKVQSSNICINRLWIKFDKARLYGFG